MLRVFCFALGIVVVVARLLDHKKEGRELSCEDNPDGGPQIQRFVKAVIPDDDLNQVH
jgi:hypothetical protein